MRAHPRRRRASPRAAVTALLLATVAALAAPVRPAGAYPGAPWFQPSKPYTENFPDPSVLVDGGTYYAYSTTTGGAYLPVMTSTDLATWTARPAYPFPNGYNGDRFYNDALVQPAAWVVDHGGPLGKDVRVPGVARIGGRYVAFYAAGVGGTRSCIAVATADSPLGPFADTSPGPVVCDADPNGSNDPQPFVEGDGTPYLVWKSEGVPGSVPTRIWIQRLDAGGTHLLGGSQPTLLLETDQPWEGNVVENPSLVRWRGRYLLFFSGNEWRSADYATGVATCDSVLGPCHTFGGNPILASGGGRLGPGGAAAFVDLDGQLQLMYHWWNAPYTAYPAYPACLAGQPEVPGQPNGCTTQGQRRFAVAPVYQVGVGFRVGGPPPSPGGPGPGYWMLGAEGAVYAFGGAADLGAATADIGPRRAFGVSAVDLEPTPSFQGYWIVDSVGGVSTFGDAAFAGAASAAQLAPGERVTSLSATPSGQGYWLFTSRGRALAFGDAPFLGDMAAVPLQGPVLDSIPTPSGQGYFMVASDGGIFAFGDATFLGSMGGRRLNAPVQSLVPDGDGSGYWLVASDGGIFAFDAAFAGSMGGTALNRPITGMVRSGNGYLMVGEDGGIFSFSDQPFAGSLGDTPPPVPVVSVAVKGPT
jgi:hypothetical protein